MSTQVHRSAMVHPDAYLAGGVRVGPYCVIGEDVQIGEGTRLESHVSILPLTRIGKNCHIWPGAVLGGPPQDHKFKGETSYLVIGDNDIIRECVTLHRAAGEGAATRIGNDNMIMAYAHVGHNCEIGNGNTISSYVGLSGHVRVEDNVVFGGMVGVHQYTRIGKLAIIGGLSKVNTDVPPFMMADGVPCRVIDLNKIGLRRYGIPPATRSTLRQAYKLLYRSNLNHSQAMERIEDELASTEELAYLIKFMRGIQAGVAGRGNYQHGP
ncbi:MAG TPA: acyl-ACP--UDP-N-acetylglucosamine O-acyltransferase [Chthonomonadales bacterium]|nr:acyl-ACP--UDP-N-acetylglucosamine O-acyltransferase [Chthonomonadales bacterium]